jgi:hypothetical protein
MTGPSAPMSTWTRAFILESYAGHDAFHETCRRLDVKALVVVGELGALHWFDRLRPLDWICGFGPVDRIDRLLLVGLLDRVGAVSLFCPLGRFPLLRHVVPVDALGLDVGTVLTNYPPLSLQWNRRRRPFHAL